MGTTVLKITQARYIWTALLVLWSYVDFEWEILVIVNAAVEGPTFFHIWSEIALRQCTFHIWEYAGPYMV